MTLIRKILNLHVQFLLSVIKVIELLHTFMQHAMYLVKRRAYDQHGTARAILLYPWERHFPLLGGLTSSSKLQSYLC